jgi:hypothetical protein
VKVTEKPDGTVEVDTGRQPGAAKSAGTWDGETVVGMMVKAEPERRYTLHVIYPADKADVAIALDGHRDFASKGAVEDAAWEYMRNYRHVGAYHADGTEGAGELVESYIYRGPDWTIKAADDSEVVIKSGDWMGGFIWTPPAWADVLAGKIGGVSPQGKARRAKASADTIAALRS